MPANALTIENRAFTSFTARESNRGTDITGEYTLTIVNNGFLPVPSVSVSIAGVSVGGSTIIEDKTTSVGRIGGGQEAEATFEFETTSQGLSRFASQACSGSPTELEVEESVGGLLLAITVEDTVEVKSPSPSCQLTPGDGLPDLPSPEPEPPDGEEPQPEPPDPPENEPGPEPGAPEVEAVGVIGPTDPTENSEATYEVVNEPDGIETYTWNNTKTREVDNTEQNEYTTTFNSPGDFEITVEGRNSNNQLIAEGSTSGEVQSQNGDGGEDGQDAGGDGTCTNDPPEDTLGDTDPSDGEISSVDITSVDVNGDTATVNYEAEGFIFSGTVGLEVYVKVPSGGFGGQSIVESGTIHSQGQNNRSYSQDLDIGCIDDDFTVTLTWDDSAGNSGTSSSGGSISPSGGASSGLPLMDQAAELKDRRYD